MRTLYTLHITGKIRRRIKLMSALVLLLIAVAASFNKATAQRANLSDWRVPPPLSPGNLTKGNTTGKEAKGKSIVLSFVDVPVPSQPAVSPVQVPVLAAISTTPSAVNVPGQPAATGSEAGLPDLPLPDAPDAPALQQKSSGDAPVPEVINLPVPSAPEMPPLPTEPASSGQTSGKNGPIPIMPAIVSEPPPSLPKGNIFTTWPTPAVPEDESVKQPTSGSKSTKPGNKGTQKIKSP